MGKRRFWLGWLMAIAVLVSSLVWTPQALAFTEDQKVFLQAWRIVNQSYVDDSFNGQNWWFMRQRYLRHPFRDREDAYEAIDEMLASLDDPYTRLLRPEQYRSLQVSTSGELTGIGVQINLEPQTLQLQVISPIAGSPAERAGIRAGDRILEIDGVSTQNLSLDEAAMKMRGKIGTRVVLTLDREEKTEGEKVEIVRDLITLKAVSANLDSTGTIPIGYLRLSQFSANATQELAQAIADLGDRGAKGYILDLRNNPGGLLQAGVGIARLWLNDAPIVYTVNRQGMLGSFDADRGAITDSPLVVLVNQGSASASEILAGALQDNHRAKLLGEQTFGKGLIQSLFELPDDSGLAVTVAKYETPSHHDINKLGITPDEIVAQEPISLQEVGGDRDLQYQAAIELLEAKSILANAT
ncbi:carboxyl-terminal processing protease CtpA [Spirulina sp. 06S082]|uniref:carboxyl-terminal processing protease CtpA n=1 Tax=Spirulina sp. 06S082 TaxID=3110248 RepID=UPI002B209F1A|nr:carboxyl-terminal processing protease CtpA [Spirulina sp. 06S082]MEA5468457.1 S41 family peptidase [Spirulina sp. 06S082]